MILQPALDTAEAIRASLEAEVELARGERLLIRNIDVAGLHARAERRAEFNQRTADLQLRLASDLRAASDHLGLPEVTLTGLEAHLPLEGRALGRAFADIRALATALHELDAMNLALGQRALSYVRAHLAVLCPRPISYNRRGTSPTDHRSSTHVRVV
jgi:hypothetical protein